MIFHVLSCGQNEPGYWASGSNNIPQYETTATIKEGLQSSQELEAVAAVHLTCIRYIFDFHKGQAFERWVN